MKQLYLIVALHLFLFLLLFAYHAQADEDEWQIDSFETLSYARVSGEVIHGDSLNFFIQSKNNCEKVWHNFTFVTSKDPGDIKQLLDKHIQLQLMVKK